jgi:hypothetical protein
MDRRAAGETITGGVTMAVYLCRWPNGDCSFVSARSKTDAIELLDHDAGNAEGSPIVRLDAFQVHFTLTEEGRLQLDAEGIWSWNSVDTEPAVRETAYPLLDQVLGDIENATGNKEWTLEQQARVREAVAQERERVTPKQVREPKTAAGRAVKAMWDMPTSLAERLAREAVKPKGSA